MKYDIADVCLAGTNLAWMAHNAFSRLLPLCDVSFGFFCGTVGSHVQYYANFSCLRGLDNILRRFGT